MRTPNIEIGNLKANWADVRLIADDHEFTDSISAVPNDGLGEFVAVVERVIGERASRDVCRWSNEPGYWLVTVQSLGSELELTIQFDSNEIPGARPDTRTYFWATFEPLELARRVSWIFRGLQQELGLDGYAERWGHRFPELELSSLERWLKQLKLETEGQVLGE